MDTEELSGRHLRLDTLLAAIDDEEAMLLGELEGYLCGVLIAPSPIPQDEWLPPILLNVLPEALPREEELLELIELIIERHAEIGAELAADAYQALYDIDPVDESVILWEVWMAGFERAMTLRLSAWEKLLQSHRESIAQESLFLFMELLRIGTAQSPLSDTDSLELEENAPDLIPELAGNLYRAHVIAPSRAPVRAPSVGRNDPCPCGSGLKYKRCHGAA